MRNKAAKDPKRQIQGAVSRAQGRRFEERLDDSFAYYADRGFAIVEKTPEPMRPTKSLGNGKFIAFFEKKAQPDYKGTIKGGRTVLFEAKFTSTDRMTQDRVGRDQSEYLSRYQRLGARCYVVAGFASGDVYRIPWDVWLNMKTFFGRKYVKETDLEKFCVHIAWNGVLQLLE
ncbi:Holliday junction resolvase RecU [Agathobaculum desmolans]|uniref:Holliday junction resolvase RecU n=1 Tax=Agathobaculum desmolans TaxID=39484 RepID=UPI0004E2218A|nr:Holliday junction resolvase RecU [Agathobaculum desmolans]